MHAERVHNVTTAPSVSFGLTPQMWHDILEHIKTYNLTENGNLACPVPVRGTPGARLRDRPCAHTITRTTNNGLAVPRSLRLGLCQG